MEPETSSMSPSRRELLYRDVLCESEVRTRLAECGELGAAKRGVWCERLGVSYQELEKVIPSGKRKMRPYCLTADEDGQPVLALLEDVQAKADGTIPVLSADFA